MDYARNFDEQNYNKSIIEYLGEKLREREASKENFDELPIIHQICQTFPQSTICTSYLYGI